MLDKYKFQYYLLLISGNIFRLLSLFSIKISSSILAFIFYNIIRIRRKVVDRNLLLAFPEMKANEIRKLAYRNYRSIAITFIEILKIKSMTDEHARNTLSSDGFNIIREKLSLGKGLILLTGHFGNWELAANATGLILDQSITVLVKKQKNKFVAEWMTKFRERFGNKEITLGTSVRNLYRSIKEKKIVGIVGDQRGTKDGIIVKFFGKDTFTFPGTAAIALRTNCPVIIILGARQDNGVYKAILTEIKYEEFEGTMEEKIKKFNQFYMKTLEDAIREYPEQWFWMHNIWKFG